VQEEQHNRSDVVSNHPEHEGLGRLLQALSLKKQILIANIVAATLIVNIQLITFVFWYFVKYLPPSANIQTITISKSIQIFPENQMKMVCIMVRETAFVLVLAPLLFIMRMRNDFPEFYSCELTSDPWGDGIFGNFGIGNPNGLPQE